MLDQATGDTRVTGITDDGDGIERPNEGFEDTRRLYDLAAIFGRN